MTHSQTIKVAICAPSDVAKEVIIAQEVINAFNQVGFDKRNIVLQYKNWMNESSPDMSQRPQEVINRQIIDNAELIIAIFWARFGTQTGLYESGTEEEIKRALSQKKRVMVYFSKIEILKKLSTEQEAQLSKLEAFRSKLYNQGLCETFASRDEFRKKLARQLSLAVDELLANMRTLGKTDAKQAHPASVCHFGKVLGDHNIQVGGITGNFSVKASSPKIIVSRPDDCVLASELKRIADIIEHLAEGEVGITRGQAYGKWGRMFLNKFNIPKRELLPSSRMPEVESWFNQHKKIQRAGYKQTAPDEWRKNTYAFIKAKMREMGIEKETYYQELSLRLKRKRPFTSLVDLSKKDLERVRHMVEYDSKKT
jgi:hypothetical protein